VTGRYIYLSTRRQGPACLDGSAKMTNKTFAITFKTLPFDDTGVFHILEHSVLNGSDKYPVKEPFVELLKSSMQTFLNAFTAPDKTMYPVSSRNEKDFMNLMSVYMDAVFHPAIYTNPNIFYQEGWHYEIRDPKRPRL
jgi:Zn-dependent M16 (insulinase) family peptidase